MVLVPFYQNGFLQWLSQQEANGLDLVPVDLQGSTVYMTREAISKHGGFGLFGSKKRKKVESQVVQSQQIAQQNAAQVQNAVTAFQKTIPSYQAQLTSAQAELNKEVKRVGAKTEKTIAFIGLGLSLAMLTYVGVQKFKQRKSK